MGMGGGKARPGRTTMSEINVTPMVDVMLVLLIIFMVTAPLIQQGVKVNLPEAKAAPVEADREEAGALHRRRSSASSSATPRWPWTSWREARSQRQGPGRQGDLPPRRPGRCPTASWWR